MDQIRNFKLFLSRSFCAYTRLPEKLPVECPKGSKVKTAWPTYPKASFWRKHEDFKKSFKRSSPKASTYCIKPKKSIIKRSELKSVRFYSLNDIELYKQRKKRKKAKLRKLEMLRKQCKENESKPALLKKSLTLNDLDRLEQPLTKVQVKETGQDLRRTWSEKVYCRNVPGTAILKREYKNPAMQTFFLQPKEKQQKVDNKRKLLPPEFFKFRPSKELSKLPEPALSDQGSKSKGMDNPKSPPVNLKEERIKKQKKLKPEKCSLYGMTINKTSEVDWNMLNKETASDKAFNYKNDKSWLRYMKNEELKRMPAKKIEALKEEKPLPFFEQTKLNSKCIDDIIQSEDLLVKCRSRDDLSKKAMLQEKMKVLMEIEEIPILFNMHDCTPMEMPKTTTKTSPKPNKVNMFEDADENFILAFVSRDGPSRQDLSRLNRVYNE